MFSIFKKLSLQKQAAVNESFEQYEAGLPTHQKAIDALPGWNSAFPPQFGLTAGTHHLYADPRLEWAISKYGDMSGKRVLEVGPLEGMHTYRLSKENPSVIEAIEANKPCFFRCLVTKQIMNTERAVFYLGDIQEWLKLPREPYDLAIASGVLYHMPDPADFLRALAAQSRAVFIWTHYFDDEAMPRTDVRRAPFSESYETRNIDGFEVNYYERHYQDANKNAVFCGGLKDKHYWMRKSDIIELLRAFGLGNISIEHDNPNHPGGPSFSIFARGD